MMIDSGLLQNSGAELKYYLRHTGSTSKRVTFIDLFKMFHLELEIGVGGDKKYYFAIILPKTA